MTGHPDHVAATAVGLLAAEQLDRPVLGWTLPVVVTNQLNREFEARFVGRVERNIDLRVPMDHARQWAASRAHVSQAMPGSVLWWRLELLGGTEHLRRLRHPGAEPRLV